MNDEKLEQHLRNLPTPELPDVWRAEILAVALREASPAERTHSAWPPLLIFLRNLFARNPITAGALTALWLLIFLFKAGTPVDPAEKNLIAHYDPNRPIYFVSLREEILLVQLLQDQPDQRRVPQIP
jgi:hypothetical protein